MGSTKANGRTCSDSGKFSPFITASVLIVSETAQYYAALCEWVSGERRHHDFTTNVYLDAYKSHILALDKIEGKRPTSYHNMMADIYQFAV